jgi:hypothetical protein
VQVEECRPVNMPALRDDAVRGVKADARMRATQKGFDELSKDDQRALQAMSSADLFWISEEMSELCRDAVDGLTEAHLGRDLWPADAGFMVFATPVPVEGHEWRNDNDASREPIRALAWYLDGSDVTVLLFVDVTDMVAATLVRVEGKVDPARHRERSASFSAEMGMRWLTPATGDVYPMDRPYRLEEHQGSGAPAGFMLSTVWLLMGQRGLASTTTGVPVPKNKAARRRQAPVREQLDAVRIIELRAGTDHAAAYAGATRAYRHRWMVKGHWRQQWYPSLGMNRPVWIAPYVKGPDGAPLLTGEKVHTWRGR